MLRTAPGAVGSHENAGQSGVDGTSSCFRGAPSPALPSFLPPLSVSLALFLSPSISVWLFDSLCCFLHHPSLSFYFTHSLSLFLPTAFPLQPSNWPRTLPLAPHPQSTRPSAPHSFEARSCEGPPTRVLRTLKHQGWVGPLLPAPYSDLLAFQISRPKSRNRGDWLPVAQFVPEAGLEAWLPSSHPSALFAVAFPEADTVGDHGRPLNE